MEEHSTASSARISLEIAVPEMRFEGGGAGGVDDVDIVLKNVEEVIEVREAKVREWGMRLYVVECVRYEDAFRSVVERIKSEWRRILEQVKHFCVADNYWLRCVALRRVCYVLE